MSREILFRGKTDNKWVYGVPIYLRKEAYIVRDFCLGGSYTDDLVEAETIGQFTGLTDKNGKKIFEKDYFNIAENVYQVVYECCEYILTNISENDIILLKNNYMIGEVLDEIPSNKKI